MMTFDNYMLLVQAEQKIDAIARRMVEAVGNSQVQVALNNAKGELMKVFNAQMQADPTAALTWLNDLYTKQLPTEYKTLYQQWQQKNQQNQQQPNQNQPNQQQNNTAANTNAAANQNNNAQR